VSPVGVGSGFRHCNVTIQYIEEKARPGKRKKADKMSSLQRWLIIAKGELKLTNSF